MTTAIATAKTAYKRCVPDTVQYAVRALRRRGDMRACRDFINNSQVPITRSQRVDLVLQMYWITLRVNSQHTQQEILSYVEHILCLPKDAPPVVVEAGCFKGGSTAKFSLAAKLAGKRLYVFDSFEGLPDIHEEHGKNIFGMDAAFRSGTYAGALEEVRANVTRYGAIEVCEFVPGWFSDTMPTFKDPIAAAYLDVDLVASTKDCLVNLFPLLDQGGTVFSQDGHLPKVLEVFEDETFWRSEVGVEPPALRGIRHQKLISAAKQ